ncbi:MAG: cysteine peptidase family C39 domain-containing protein [Planctomycetota bacterium]|jgi:hypothetical protein
MQHSKVLTSKLKPLILVITLSFLLSSITFATDYRYVPGGYTDGAVGRSDVVYIANVPDIEWYYGCAPTSAGDVLAYWQTEQGATGLGNIGDWESTIASDGHINAFYEDPKVGDRGGSNVNVSADVNAGSHLTKDSIADYMGTSRWGENSISNGGTMSWYYNSPTDGTLVAGKQGNDASWGVKDFIEDKGHTADVKIFSFDNFSFAQYQAEIDAGRPTLLGVDSSGDGNTDHFAVGFGYDPSSNEYLTYSEWGAYGEFYSGNSSRYETWTAVSGGQSWGVSQIMTINITSAGGAGTPEPSSIIIMILGFLLVMPQLKKKSIKV